MSSTKFELKNGTAFRRKIDFFTCVMFLACLSLVVFLHQNGFIPQSTAQGSSPTHSPPDGGDCQAFKGPRRPQWADPAKMRAAIPEFAALYAKRPIQDNEGGMRFDHSFAAWYTLRAVQPPPTTVIESGAYNGHSTWIIAEALPKARIISLDKSVAPQQRLPGVEYMVLDDFIDFAMVDWKAKGVDPRTAIVFLDDHQSGFRRVFREGHHLGFLRYILEDNYPYLEGDNLSMKWVCERERRDAWPGIVHDDFDMIRTPQTWEEHLKQGDEAERKTKYYYEFPPVAHETFTKQMRYNSKYASQPIVTTQSDYDKLIPKLPAIEFAMYTHFSYMELKEDTDVN